MTGLVIIMSLALIIALYLGNRFLKDARAIRNELADGKTLKELNTMVKESRDELVADYDKISQGLDKRIERLDKLNRKAEETAARLEAVLNSDKLKSLEERGIIFAIEASDKSSTPEADRNKRISDLLKGGASVEEVARITEASIREVELIRLLLRRREEAEGA